MTRKRFFILKMGKWEKNLPKSFYLAPFLLVFYTEIEDGFPKWWEHDFFFKWADEFAQTL